MHTLLRNNLGGMSEEMLCGSLALLGMVALLLLCLHDPCPRISAMGSAGTSAINRRDLGACNIDLPWVSIIPRGGRLPP